MGVGNRK